MSSLNTNIAAMTALQALRSTNADMLQTQNRISTGLRVATASDNAAYWSIATTMRSDRQALSTVSDALGLGSATVDIASRGHRKRPSQLRARSKTSLWRLVSPASTAQRSRQKSLSFRNLCKDVVKGANFSGQNWLQGDSTGTTTPHACFLVLARQHRAQSPLARSRSTPVATGSMLIDHGGAGAGILDTERDCYDR